MSDKIVKLPTAIPLRPDIVDRRNRSLRDLRISVMDRCNFRCPYCMPEDKYHKDFKFLDSSERLSFGEILRVATIFAGLGVEKLRITGGEPLLRPGLSDLIGDLSRIEGIRDMMSVNHSYCVNCGCKVRLFNKEDSERFGDEVKKRKWRAV